MRTRGSMSIVDSAWLAAGATSRRHSAASQADVQMTAGVEPSSRAGVFRRMLTSRVRRRHSRASMSCCIPPCGCHQALPCRSRGPLPRAKHERGAQARRIAGVYALEGWTEEPPGGPTSQHTRTPFVRRSRAAEGAASPARSPSRTARRARATPRGSMATAWVAGGRCNERGWTTRVEHSIGSPRSRHTASTRAQFLIPIAAVSTGPCGVWSVAIRPPSRSVFSTISTGIPARDR